MLDKLISKDAEAFLANEVHNKSLKRKNCELRAKNKIAAPQCPTTVTLVNVRGGKKNRRTVHEGLRVLLDTGCSDSLLLAEFVKKNKKIKKPSKYATGGGAVSTKYETKVNFSLPEFSDKKVVTWKFKVFESTTLGYDMVIGRDIMSELGMDLSFNKKTMIWEGIEIPMRDFNKLRKYQLNKKELQAFISESKEPVVTQKATDRIIRILDANYKRADLRQVANKAIHLTSREREMLYELLLKYKSIFDGSLGDWKTDPVELELKEGAEPHSQRHYPIPRIHREVFKKDLDRLEKLGVLERTNESEWGSPTFIIPKKNGTVRFISDFRRLNQKIKRKPYPLPRISDTLQQLEGFTFATALDINMGYYHIRLSDKSADMCTIVTEFGKYKYKRLPMGVSCSPDIFQAKIYELLGDIQGTKAYIDDILVIHKGKFYEHLQQLEEVFRRCKKANLQLNADKCNFCISEINYLGYIVTPEGVRPDPQKIKAIQAMERPSTVTEIRRFIGMIQYYRDLWPRRSHILQPFTAVSSGKKGTKIKWTPELEAAFHETKKMVCKETLLTYPDWTKPFDIHTDASDYQLGAVISQEGKPIAFFSRKLNSAQRNYTTTEKELLSIVECLKEFRNILFGYPIKVFSDHKNLVHAATISQSQRVMRWRLILEEFGPDIKHISGEMNVVADAISRLPTTITDQNEPSTEALDLSEKENFILEDEVFPLELSLVQRTQNVELNKRKSKLKQLVNDTASKYHIMELDGHQLVGYEGKIYVPKTLRQHTMSWYHHFLNHPGGERLYKTLRKVCYWKGMASQCITLCKKCAECQQFKPRKTKYGHVPPKNVGVLVPWDTVHTDLIGPYTITTDQYQVDGSTKEVTLQLTCMTMLDPVTGWFEIVEVPQHIIQQLQESKDRRTKHLVDTSVIDKSSARISRLFNQVWLSRYPRPKTVVFDNGSEFKKDFVPLLKDFSIKPKCTTVKNPQANSPVERIHQVLRHMLLTKNLIEETLDYVDPFGSILSSVAWAVRSSYNNTTNATPAQLVFGRDMMFNLSTLVNWKELSLRKQALVDKANLRENKKRIDYDYQAGDLVYKLKDGILRKLESPKEGPYPITEVFTNGTVRIQRGMVNERINIRRLEPHF